MGRAEDAARMLLAGEDPGQSRFDSKVLNPTPAQRPPPRPGMVRVFTPESDFMEEVDVQEGSPQHLQILRRAIQMEPDGPEARYMRDRGMA